MAEGLDPQVDITEEYDDLRPRLQDLSARLAAHPPGNDTLEGRMRHVCEWLASAVTGQRLPIPLDRSYWGVLLRVHLDGPDDPLLRRVVSQIALILDGTGLFKERDRPVLTDQLSGFIADYARAGAPLTTVERAFVQYLDDRRREIARGERSVPLDEAEYGAVVPDLEAIARPLDADPDLLPDFMALRSVLLQGARPRGCQKPPLRAPTPGLPQEAERV